MSTGIRESSSFFSKVAELGFERTEENKWTLIDSLLQFEMNFKTREVDVSYNGEEVGSYSPAEFIKNFESIKDYFCSL